ncbi:Wzz/FepE/Etk N-terminal domain-containing protein [Vibrio sp. F74]|uniref:Wzz/FepE/Etk N-terminal domain-containing protein n=1 Tax=Vibrio sp. F74 TaxID=700020 RepID=UPI0035F5BD7E
MDLSNQHKKQLLSDVHNTHNYEGDARFLELITVFWQKKLIVVFSSIIFSIFASIYIFFAPEWWNSKAVITLPQVQDYSDFRLQVAQFQPILNTYQKDGVILIDKTLEEMVKPEVVFDSFISAFNANYNKRAYLEGTPSFATNLDKIDINDKLKVSTYYSLWFNKISARYQETTNDRIVVLSASSPTQFGSTTLLREYISFVTDVVKNNHIKNLKASIDYKTRELLQSELIAVQLAKHSIKNEILITRNSLKIATSANIVSPLLNFRNEDIFPITLGSSAIKEKLKLLESIDSMQIFEPRLAQINVKLNLITQTKVTNKINFQPFRYLAEPETPSNKNSPKSMLIIILSILIGIMVGLAIIAIRHIIKLK